jgi:hypothetical protein
MNSTLISVFSAAMLKDFLRFQPSSKPSVRVRTPRRIYQRPCTLGLRVATAGTLNVVLRAPLLSETLDYAWMKEGLRGSVVCYRSSMRPSSSFPQSLHQLRIQEIRIEGTSRSRGINIQSNFWISTIRIVDIHNSFATVDIQNSNCGWLIIVLFMGLIKRSTELQT